MNRRSILEVSRLGLGPRPSIDPEDIENFEQYRSIDWERAYMIATSESHGVVIAPDFEHHLGVRLALLGSRAPALTPKLKAHNGFSREQALEIAVVMRIFAGADA